MHFTTYVLSQAERLGDTFDMRVHLRASCRSSSLWREPAAAAGSNVDAAMLEPAR